MIDAYETAHPTPDSAIADVYALNEQYIAAAGRGDAAWFREHMDEDVLVILGDGARLAKEAFLARTAGQTHRFRSLTVRDVTVRVFGATVQVDADAPWELADGRRGVSRYIDTYLWRDGRWLVISAQVTAMPAEGAD
jgi:hypothetical protein